MRPRDPWTSGFEVPKGEGVERSLSQVSSLRWCHEAYRYEAQGACEDGQDLRPARGIALDLCAGVDALPDDQGSCSQGGQ